MACNGVERLQEPEKYSENFDILSEGPASGGYSSRAFTRIECQNSRYIFQVPQRFRCE